MEDLGLEIGRLKFKGKDNRVKLISNIGNRLYDCLLSTFNDYEKVNIEWYKIYLKFNTERLKFSNKFNEGYKFRNQNYQQSTLYDTNYHALIKITANKIIRIAF
jgi:hypothetical protein